MPAHAFAGAFVNARVLPMTTPDAEASAVCWADGRIIAVGDDEHVAGIAATHGIEPQDLDGRVVLPGFVDAHMHLLHVGIRRTRPDLSACASRDEVLAALGRWHEAHRSDGAIIGEGWDESDWPDRTRITRDELDRISPARPIVARRMCGHIAVANSAAIAAVWTKWSDASLVDRQTGLLLEAPSLYLNEVLPSTAQEADAAVIEACHEAHRLGVTAVGAYEQAPYRAALQRAGARGILTVRVSSNIYVQQLAEETASGFRTGRRAVAPSDHFPPDAWLPVVQSRPVEDLPEAPSSRQAGGGLAWQQARGGGMPAAGGAGPAQVADLAPATMAAQPGKVPLAPEGGPRGPEGPGERAQTGIAGAPRGEGSSPWLQDGGLKVFLDGSLGAHTALLRDPYDDRPGHRGMAIWSDAQLDRIFMHAHRAGIQVHAHAIGDGAVAQGLAAFERLVARVGDWWEDDAGGPWGGDLPERSGLPEREPTERPGGRTSQTGEGEVRGGSGALGGLPAERVGREAMPARDAGAPAPRGSAREHPMAPGGRVNRLRHRFEHYEIVPDDLLERTVRLGIVACSQPNFVGVWSSAGGMYERRLGDRYLHNNRFATFRGRGLAFSFGSDGMPFGPLEGIQAAVNHPDSAERLGAREAIWHYTNQAAWSIHMEETGRIAPGCHADIVVLDRTDLDGEPRAWRFHQVLTAGVLRAGTATSSVATAQPVR